MKFDEYMIRVMKLERLADFIVYPKEVPKRSPRYILSLIYPNRVHLNYQDLVLNIYKDVLAHKIQFPREYLSELKVLSLLHLPAVPDHTLSSGPQYLRVI